MVTYPSLEEVQRLQYLKALGVTSWLPTSSLVASQANAVSWQQDNSHCLVSAKLGSAEIATAKIATAKIAPKASALPAAAKAPVVLPATLPATEPQKFDLSQEQALIPGQIQAAAVAGALHSLSSSPETMEYTSASQKLEAQLQPDRTQLISESLLSSPSLASDWIAALHLGLSWYANGVLVVNDIPAHEGATMSSPIQRLQTSIVNALRPMLKESTRQTMPAASMEFNWPLVPGPHGDHSLTGAQSGLQYSLLKLLKEQPCSALLVMGPAAMQLLKADMSLGDSGYIELSDMTIPSIFSHSLHQLLAVPSLKAETWKHLQPLLLTEKIG